MILDQFDVVIKAKTEPRRFTYVCGLPFGQAGDVVTATVARACLTVKSELTDRNPITLQTRNWSYRIDTTDIQAIAVEIQRDDRTSWLTGLLPFLARRHQNGACGQRALVVRAAISPDRVQVVRLTGAAVDIESLTAELEAECHFYRDKRQKDANEGWRD